MAQLSTTILFCFFILLGAVVVAIWWLRRRGVLPPNLNRDINIEAELTNSEKILMEKYRKGSPVEIEQAISDVLAERRHKEPWSEQKEIAIFERLVAEDGLSFLRFMEKISEINKKQRDKEHVF